MNAPYNVRTFRAQHKGWTSDDHQSAADRLKSEFQRVADTPGAGIPMTVGALSSAHSRIAGGSDVSSGLKELRSHHAKIAEARKPAPLEVTSSFTRKAPAAHAIVRDLRAEGIKADTPKDLGKSFRQAWVILQN